MQKILPVKLFLVLFSIVVSNTAFTQTKTNETSGSPTGNPNVYIKSFSPATATTGDTVTIQLLLPETIASVTFGGVPAASFSGGVFDAKVKAVVGNGASGSIKLSGSFPGLPGNTDSVSGFTFIPPVLDMDVLFCGPTSDTKLIANLSGSSYQWQVSIDSTNFLPLNDDTIYNGVLTDTLHLSGISYLQHGFKYRCMVDGSPGKVFTLKFENTWLGGAATDWSNPLNWSCGVVPGGNSNVVISQGNVILNNSITVNSITIQPGAHLTVNTGAVLTVTH